MKICPNCQQTYEDDGLNFCLNDGGNLEPMRDQSPPPTIIMNQARPTSPNVGNDFSQPISSWQNPQPMQSQMPNQPYIPPMYSSAPDQTLPIISLVVGSLGILLSLCCYAGIPLGIGGLITGFLGMQNVNQDPQKYGGKNLAIGGMITGGIGLMISLGLILIGLILR